MNNGSTVLKAYVFCSCAKRQQRPKEFLGGEAVFFAMNCRGADLVRIGHIYNRKELALKRALYLSGGGARGAYQVGVLKAINEIIGTKKLPVDILSSVSAGAINAAMIGMHADDFSYAVNKLEQLWRTLTCEKIFKTSNLALLKSIARNVGGIIFGRQMKGGGYLLDTQPLKALLNDNINFDKINDNIASGLLPVFEVSASCYEFAENVSFFNSSTEQSQWKRARQTSHLTPIMAKHILASSSIPFFFPAVTLNNAHYGDGAIRLSSPLRAAIKLGAEQILIIGTRKSSLLQTSGRPSTKQAISFAKVLGSMLNALFMDNLDRDLELLIKINALLALLSDSDIVKSQWRPIKVLSIFPSVDLASLTAGKQKSLPLFLRYVMSVFGSKKQSGDILSFLLFEPEYCNELINVGYRDAMLQRDEIRDFFAPQ